ncbi:MAG: hypothetical protein ACRD2W_19940 [Acidimicrobiales bacterium]
MIVVAAAVVAVSLLAAPDDNRTIVEPPIAVDNPAPPTATMPELLSEASRLRLDGIGPVVVGMSLEEASAATGQDIRIDPRTDLGRGCAHATAEGGPEGLQFMVVDGRIARVEVVPGPVRTVSGVGVGSTQAEVLAAYPDRIRVQANPYSGHLGGKDLIYVPDASSEHLSLLFEVLDGLVMRFRSGWLPAVMAPEGCS